MSPDFSPRSRRISTPPGPAAKGKAKKETGGKQTTLFGLPPGAPPEKKSAGRKKKAADSQATAIDSQQTEADSQDADVVMVASTPPEPETQTAEQSQVPTEADAEEREGSEEPIEWPESPVARAAELAEV